MCRHLAYLGPPVPLGAVISHPPFSLARQAWAPRRQRHGTVNADGFGVGWYAPPDPFPARYRRFGPLWADPDFQDLARVVRAPALLAAVRSATPGMAPDSSAAAPYRSGRWLFSHNGVMNGWPESAASLASTLPAAELLELEARCDSAFLWALVLRRLRAGADPRAALEGVLGDVAEHGVSGRFNFLLTDGEVIAATAAGDTLCHRAGGGACVVASEPGDDEPGWADVPDGSVLVAAADHVEVRPLTN